MERSSLPTNNAVSDKELQRGYWFATHVVLLKKIGMGLLFIITAVNVLLFVWQLVVWMTHIQSTNDILSTLSNPSSPVIRQAPLDVQVLRSFSVGRDDAHIDLVSEVYNPNPTWSASVVEYELLLSGQSIAKGTFTLSPEQKYIVTSTQVPLSATDILPQPQLVIHDVTWKRHSDRATVPVDAWDFLNPSFHYIDALTDVESFQSQLDFTLKNKSVFGFREPQIIVYMVDTTGQVQALGTLSVTTIQSLEERSVKFLWPRRLPSNLTPVIHMNVDKVNESRIIRELTNAP